MNICGVLVHASPARVGQLAVELGLMGGVEVHATAPGGRIVVTVEDTTTTTALDTMAAINRLGGIVAASLVYHHFEPATDSAAARS